MPPTWALIYVAIAACLAFVLGRTFAKDIVETDDPKILVFIAILLVVAVLWPIAIPLASGIGSTGLLKEHHKKEVSNG